MTYRDRKEVGDAHEPPPNYDAYLQEQLARWAVEDVDESETPEEEIARREKRARITQAAVNRYLLDFAEYGICGDPLRSEPGKLDIALAYAEEAEADDLAVAEPLKDLHWILKNGTREECAQGVGAAWRAQHPFRPTRSGDPYEMSTPQNSRVRAMAALDQAAQLPSVASSVALGRHDAAVKRALTTAVPDTHTCLHATAEFNQYPCTRTTALAALAEARIAASSGEIYHERARVGDAINYAEKRLTSDDWLDPHRIDGLLVAARTAGSVANNTYHRVNSRQLAARGMSTQQSVEADPEYIRMQTVNNALRYVAAYGVARAAAAHVEAGGTMDDFEVPEF